MKKSKLNKTTKIRIPRHRRTLMRRRTKVQKQLQNKKLSIKRRHKLKHELTDIELSLKSDYCSERTNQENSAIEAIKTNSKYFFSYAKKFSKVHTGIGPLTDKNSNTITCANEMAKMLSKQYASVWTTPSSIQNEGTTADESYPTISNIEHLESAIDELTNNASPGPDKFPAILLKKCKTSLSVPLFLIWRKSLDTSVINNIQNSANIIPIHQGGSKAIPKNYRPIDLTSHLIKIFEKVIRNKLVSYLEQNNLLNPTQYGFRIGRSCLSQLLEHFDKITKLMEDGHDVDVVYVDFAKGYSI